MVRWKENSSVREDWAVLMGPVQHSGPIRGVSSSPESWLQVWPPPIRGSGSSLFVAWQTKHGANTHSHTGSSILQSDVFLLRETRFQPKWHHKSKKKKKCCCFILPLLPSPPSSLLPPLSFLSLSSPFMPFLLLCGSQEGEGGDSFPYEKEAKPLNQLKYLKRQIQTKKLYSYRCLGTSESHCRSLLSLSSHFCLFLFISSFSVKRLWSVCKWDFYNLSADNFQG